MKTKERNRMRKLKSEITTKEMEDKLIEELRDLLEYRDRQVEDAVMLRENKTLEEVCDLFQNIYAKIGVRELGTTAGVWVLGDVEDKVTGDFNKVGNIYFYKFEDIN